MDLQLSGKVAIVTGASRGIGRAIAETLAAEGMKLTLVARSRDQLESLAATIKTNTLIQAIDLRAPEAPAAVVSATVDEFGRLDLLVNNASATKRGNFLELSDADWDDGYALKFSARCAARGRRGRTCAPRAAASSTSSALAGAPDRRVPIGGAVNASVLNLTKCLADRGEGGCADAINRVDRHRAPADSCGNSPPNAGRGGSRGREMASAFKMRASASQPGSLAWSRFWPPAVSYCRGAIVDTSTAVRHGHCMSDTRRRFDGRSRAATF